MRRRAVLAALPLGLAACATGTADVPQQPVRLVFFEDDSIRLGPNAMNVIAEAATAARAASGPVTVTGYVAPEPGQAPIVALSRARAEAVTAELVRLGVPQSRIRVQGRGAASFDTGAAVEARRVEIRIGG